MTTEHPAPESTPTADRGLPADRRPFGFWLKVVDRRLSAEMAELFAGDGLTRRDWRALNLLAGAAADERLAQRLARRPELLDRLAERGWVADGTLTDAGRDARDRLQERVSGLRARVAGAVSPEDFATTVATLEAIARELGWDESAPPIRGKRGGRRFGRGFGPGFGHGFGHGFGPAHDVADPDARRFGRRGRGFGPGFAHVERGFEPDGRGHRHEHRGHGHDHGHDHGGRNHRHDEVHGRTGRPGPGAEVHVHVHLHDGR